MGYSVRMNRHYFFSIWFVASILFSGCSSQRIVPESMEPLVDRTVSFRDVQASPESYKGRVLVLGAERKATSRQHADRTLATTA